MKIYTRTGDKGRTRFWSGESVLKADPAIEALGDIDELAAALGLARAELRETPLDALLTGIETELYRLMAEVGAGGKPLDPSLLIGEDAVLALESAIDFMEARLPPLKDFILPGSGRASAALHLARAVCRRAERRLVALHEARPQREVVLAYANRLSDFLFVAAREADRLAGEGDRLFKTGL
jgi:cob(I)alamin adenosyltransferase